MERRHVTGSRDVAGSEILRGTALVFLMSGLGIVAAMGVQILIAALAGLSTESDSFFIAYTVPVLFATLFTSSKQVLVSVFSKTLETLGTDAAHHFYSVVLSLGFVVFSAIAIADYMLAPLMVKALSPGAGSETHRLAVDLLRVVGWIPLFLGLSQVAGAMLNASHCFGVDASNNFVQFTVSILAGLAFRRAGVHAIAAGLLVGAAVQLVTVIVACHRQLGYRYRPNFNYRDAGAAETGQLVWVAVKGAMIQQGIPVSNRVLASFLPVGTIALIQYGNRLTVPVGIVFFGSVVAATLPTLARSMARGDQHETWRILRLGWRLITLISLPLAALLVGLNRPMVSLLFAWSSSGASLVDEIAPLSLLYNLSLLFYGFVALQTAYFYAAGQRKRVLRVLALTTAVDVVLKAVLLRLVGPPAFAISFAVAHVVAVVVGVGYVSRDQGIPTTKLLQFDGTLVLASVAIGAGCYLVAQRIGGMLEGGVVADALSIAGGLGVAAGIAAVYVVVRSKGDFRKLGHVLQGVGTRAS